MIMVVGGCGRRGRLEGEIELGGRFRQKIWPMMTLEREMHRDDNGLESYIRLNGRFTPMAPSPLRMEMMCT